MMAVRVEALGFAAPGLESWPEGRRVLRGDTPYVGGEWPSGGAEGLAANERRRVTATIRLALKVAREADGESGLSAATRSVFATCCGDLELTARICKALATAQPSVSPTQFHNSVQNAPAGYWAIAKGSNLASTTISALWGTFSAGLLEAAAQVQAERVPVLLVAYDYPAPEPFDKLVPVREPFGVAMVLAPERDGDRRNSIARLGLELVRDARESTMSRAVLEQLRHGNPAARSVPLLEVLAQQANRRVTLPYSSGRYLAVDVMASPVDEALAESGSIRGTRCTTRKT